ncbi:MAG: hypothetical protein DRP45_00490 [Candidatus Zixiibacteriota bacterium]|nr:MAG: hypothetical protein DRP45_00490 [candidate division Zixibacteria bacterium]
MRKAIIVIVVVFLWAGNVSAQQADVVSINQATASSGIGVKPVSSPWSLLDMSRISWSHSYSVSFFSGGSTSGSAGLLHSTMFYELSPKLSLSFSLGVLHNSNALWNNDSHNANLLPGFQLDYHPSDNFRMSISVQRGMGYHSPFVGRSFVYPHNPRLSE